MDNLPESVPQEALPDQDFMEMVNRIEGSQKVTESPTSPSDDIIMVETLTGPVALPKKAVETKADGTHTEATPLKEPEPLQLEYRFTGQCGKHSLDVSTLTVEVDGKTLVFAYCELCKKNIYSRVVPLLSPDDSEDAPMPKRVFKRNKKELKTL